MPTLGYPTLRYECVASTNDIARELAAAGAAEGTCVIAREQTAGRGRHGRSWSSPPGEGLYLSLILRPETDPSHSALITLAAAIAVAETLRLNFETQGDIKWPNDVLVNGRKICGILVEAAIEGNKMQYAVMGIGVNIAQKVFPEEIREQATSIFLETGRNVEPDEFVNAMLGRLEKWYAAVTSKPDRVTSRWLELSTSGNNCLVRIESSDGVTEGVTRGLTATGALIVELTDGRRREITSGELKLSGLKSANLVRDSK